MQRNDEAAIAAVRDTLAAKFAAQAAIAVEDPLLATYTNVRSVI